MSSKKPWFVYWNEDYNGNEPSFFDDFEEAPEIGVIQTEKEIIAQEVKHLINLRGGKLKAHNLSKMYDDAGWETLSIINWGIFIKENAVLCPQINKLLDDNPSIVSLSVNILRSGKRIKPHTGDTNAIVRGHLGIDIPEGLPRCGFKVNGVEKSWGNGKLLLFCDAYKHEAWNLTEKDRIIVSFDVIRKEYVDQTKYICLHVRAFLLFQALVSKQPWIEKLPKAMHYVIFKTFYMLIYMMLPYQRKHGMILKHS